MREKKTVLITGGAGGIGLCTARAFAKAGYTILLSDLREDALLDAASQLRELTLDVHTYQVNVAKKEEVLEMAAQILGQFGHLDVLINNAGVGHLGTIAGTEDEIWTRLLEVNFWGPIYHIQAFLPSMIARKEGHIANVSSGQAFFRLPSWGAYAAIKTAMGVMSEIMRYEQLKNGIKVTTIYPYMVNTGFYSDIQGETLGAKLAMKLVPLSSQSPETVAGKIFKAVKRGKGIEMVSPLNNMMQIMRMLPVVPEVVYRLTDMILAGKAKKAGELK
jgi:NAD(P)-dependent dehydrogenase (short-subunit alcohol dehydrogenase family)